LGDLFVGKRKEGEKRRAVRLEWKYDKRNTTCISIGKIKSGEEYVDGTVEIRVNGSILSCDYEDPEGRDVGLSHFMKSDIIQTYKVENNLEHISKDVFGGKHVGESILRLVLLYLLHVEGCNSVRAVDPRVKNLRVTWYLTPMFGEHFAAGGLAECLISEEKSPEFDYSESHIGFMQSMASCMVGPLESAALAKITNLKGRTSAFHSLSDSISASMRDLIEQQKEILEFQKEGLIPDDFSPAVPQQLYLTALENAVHAREADEEEFLSSVPATGLESPLQDEGITRSLVDRVVKELALPLARSRVSSEIPKMKEKPSPKISITGDDRVGVGFLDDSDTDVPVSIRARILLGVLVNILKESIEHAYRWSYKSFEDKNGSLEINIEMDCARRRFLVINKCSPEATPPSMSSNQSRILSTLIDYVPEASLPEVRVEKKKDTFAKWIRTLEISK